MNETAHRLGVRVGETALSAARRGGKSLNAPHTEQARNTKNQDEESQWALHPAKKETPCLY